MVELDKRIKPYPDNVVAELEEGKTILNVL